MPESFIDHFIEAGIELVYLYNRFFIGKSKLDVLL